MQMLSHVILTVPLGNRDASSPVFVYPSEKNSPLLQPRGRETPLSSSSKAGSSNIR
jgi:hypothetical protein